MSNVTKRQRPVKQSVLSSFIYDRKKYSDDFFWNCTYEPPIKNKSFPMYRCCLVYSFYWLWEWGETFSSRLLEWMVSWYAAKLFLKKICNISGHSVKDVMIIMWSIGHTSDKRINLEDTKRFIQKFSMWISSTVLFDNCKSLGFSGNSLFLAYLYNWIGHGCTILRSKRYRNIHYQY